MPNRIHPLNRRALLCAAALAAGAALAPGAYAQNGDFTIQPVGENSVVLTGAGENVFATRGDDGLILVDTGDEAQAGAMLGALREHFGEDRIDAAFNTHWHYENAGGNAAVKAAGGEIYSHEYTRQWLGGDFVVPWQETRYRPRSDAMMPTETFYESGSVELGGREVNYTHVVQAHTDGDIFVHFPDEDIIVAGGLIGVGEYPILDYATGGWIGGMTDATEAILEAAGPDTKIVPAVGPVVDRAHVEKQFEMLQTVRDRVYDELRAGRGHQEMLGDGVTKEFDAEWGDPTLFIVNAYPGLHGHTYEVGGIY